MNTLLYSYINLIDRLKNEEGQDLVEYALLLGLIALVAVVAITAAGASVNGIWERIVTALAAV